MTRISSMLAGGALLTLVVGCRSSVGNEAIRATNTTSAELTAAPAQAAAPVPFAGNPASVATIFDAPAPSITQTLSSTPLPQVDPHGQPLVTPSLVSPSLVEPGLENAGTTSPLYSPAPPSRMSTALPTVSTPGYEQPLVPSTTTIR